jgi:hypothetical protein
LPEARDWAKARVDRYSETPAVSVLVIGAAKACGRSPGEGSGKALSGKP